MNKEEKRDLLRMKGCTVVNFYVQMEDEDITSLVVELVDSKGETFYVELGGGYESDICGDFLHSYVCVEADPPTSNLKYHNMVKEDE
jgi:hypothetical protein